MGSLKSKKISGFTLVEVLVITGLTAIIMLATVSIFITFLLNQARISNRQEVKNTGENAIKQIVQVLREAKTITNCGTGEGEILFLDLENQSGRIYIYTSRIFLDYGEGDLMPLTPNHLAITSFTTNCYDGESSQHIQVSFTVNNNSPKGVSSEPITQDFSTSITLRN